MKQRAIFLAAILTYSGALPFLASAVVLSGGVFDFDITRVAFTYSAVIISFLCGIHWAVYLFFAERCPRNLLVSSNSIALLTWLTLFYPYQALVILLHIFSFLYLLVLDLKIRDVGIYPDWFYVLRRNATILVVSCLLVVLAAI